MRRNGRFERLAVGTAPLPHPLSRQSQQGVFSWPPVPRTEPPIARLQAAADQAAKARTGAVQKAAAAAGVVRAKAEAHFRGAKVAARSSVPRSPARQSALQRITGASC